MFDFKNIFFGAAPQTPLVFTVWGYSFRYRFTHCSPSVKTRFLAHK
jgi:hypothetical protein